MDNPKLSLFIELLEAQASGDESAIDRLREMAVPIDTGTCVFNLYQQWHGAFRFPGGRVEALQPLLSLAKKVQQYESDDTIALFTSPEWGQLLRLRGPADTVMFQKCVKCGYVFPEMVTSGFYDAGGLVCDECGNVYFKSVYDDTPTPPCTCGSRYVEQEKYGCPKCSSQDFSYAGGQSPYEYFKSHSFIRGPDA